MGPKFLLVVLYEHFKSISLHTFTLKEMKHLFMVLKFSPQENSQRTKQKSTEPKMVPQCHLDTFWVNKEPLLVYF